MTETFGLDKIEVNAAEITDDVSVPFHMLFYSMSGVYYVQYVA